MDNTLSPWFPDLPLDGHHLLCHTQLSPGTAPTRKSHKIPHSVLSLFHPVSPQSRLFQLASPTLTFTAHLLALPLHTAPISPHSLSYSILWGR